MKNRDEIKIEQQVTFGSDGELEVEAEVVETSFEDWGVVESEQSKETVYEVERASEFGVDDRGRSDRNEPRDQSELYVAVDGGQQSLSGGEAEGYSPWEN